MVYVGEAKASSIVANSPQFISVQVDARSNRGICETKVLPVAGERPSFIPLEVDACYNRGIHKAKVSPNAAVTSRSPCVPPYFSNAMYEPFCRDCAPIS